MRSLYLVRLALAFSFGLITPALAEEPCTATPTETGPPRQTVVQPAPPTREGERVEVTTSTPSGTSVSVSTGAGPNPGGQGQPVVVTEQTWKRVECK